MKRKHNGGFSLIEVLVAMAVLGIVTIPTTSALLTAHRMNVKAEQMLEAQLDVSSAVETLMATGLDKTKVQGTEKIYKETKIEQYDVTAKITDDTNPFYYKISVTSNMDEMESVCVTTYIRTLS